MGIDEDRFARPISTPLVERLHFAGFDAKDMPFLAKLVDAPASHRYARK